MTETTATPFASWAIVEMLGHLRLAGYATETTIAGAGFIRIDVPGPDGEMRPKYCAPGSIYAITPCDEETARRTANPPRYTYTPQHELEASDDYDVDDGVAEVLADETRAAADFDEFEREYDQEGNEL